MYCNSGNIYMDLLKEEINEKGYVDVIVHGNSMFPNLNDGELVTIKKCVEYNIGDVIAYFYVVDNKIKIIIHRIVLKRKDYLLTKGDNNSFIDRVKVRYADVLGSVLL